MHRSLRACAGALGLACLTIGCGLEEPNVEEVAGVAAPNQRQIKAFQDPIYKQMIGKDGRMLWSPGQGPPPAKFRKMLKQAPSAAR